MQSQSLVGRGRTADLYVREDGRVVKLFHDWFPAEDIDYEQHIAQVVYAAGVPSPCVYERVQVDGRAGLVYERLDGRSMLDAIRQRPWRVRRYGRMMANLHAAIHHAQVADLPRQHDRLRRHIQQAPHLTDAQRDTALDVLEHLPDGDTVCHGDLHPGNIVLTPRGPVAIDWIAATRGHRLGDVARTALLFAVAETEPAGSAPQRWLVDRVRRAFWGAYLERMCTVYGVPQSAVDAWMLPLTAARLYERVEGEKEWLVARFRAMKI